MPSASHSRADPSRRQMALMMTKAKGEEPMAKSEKAVLNSFSSKILPVSLTGSRSCGETFPPAQWNQDFTWYMGEGVYPSCRWSVASRVFRPAPSATRIVVSTNSMHRQGGEERSYSGNHAFCRHSCVGGVRGCGAIVAADGLDGSTAKRRIQDAVSRRRWINPATRS